MAGPSRYRVSEAAWTLPRLGSDPNLSLSQLVGPTTSEETLLQAACQNDETIVLIWGRNRKTDILAANFGC